MGGGTSSLSKVCVVGPPTRADADVDYTFAQIAVDRAIVDYGANCGNMSAAIGPFAVDERLVQAARRRDHGAHSQHQHRQADPLEFRGAGGQARVDGPLHIDGVAGSGAPIRLEFRDLAGARTGRLLPLEARCMSCGTRAAAAFAPAWWMREILVCSWTRGAGSQWHRAGGATRIGGRSDARARGAAPSGLGDHGTRAR